MTHAGMDVARLNFSHGTPASHRLMIRRIREASRLARKPIAVLQDLEGYRIRIGELSRPKLIQKNAFYEFIPGLSVTGARSIPFDYAGPLDAIRLGSHIWADDGNLSFKVVRRTSRQVRVRAELAGWLKGRKGLNIENFRIPVKGMTQKDIRDLEIGIDGKVDYVAQSFVRSAQDVEHVRERLSGRVRGVRIIAKIESPEAVRRADEIVKAADGIMIARGDLGVSVPIYKVPLIQKMLIGLARRYRKFSITATQMLESMVEHPRPTRAEASDVANAILDGSNFVMLSAETAAGHYPVEATRIMEQIIQWTEGAARRGRRVL